MVLALADKSVLVTGGTGSFGQTLIETLLKGEHPRRLIVFSRDELKQHEMQQRFNAPCMRYFLGDVRDAERLRRAMDAVDIVVHTAALKQVPACEYNPFEAVKTNILGAVNVIDAAIDTGVEQVIALSTDKAVNPINLYGATKLCAEKLFVQGNAYVGSRRTKFSCARYGNVVASRGSVIPLFQQQMKTGVLTVTDKKMTRFWLTLTAGVEFVLQCLDRMQGGEIFIPRIPSMNIMDLVEAIAPGCETEVTGIRPGEKIHELLVSSDEARFTLEFPDMYVIQPAQMWWEQGEWKDGTAVDHEFSYTSDTNPNWLSVEELREIVAGLE
jgi:UDP-N-acetylglucosamine 4,6-dehydratase